MRNLSLRLRSASPAYLDARRSCGHRLRQTALVRTHFRIATAVHRAINWRSKITIEDRKPAALSRQTVKLNALTSSPHAPQPCHHSHSSASHACHQHTLSALLIHRPQPATFALRPTQFLSPLAPQPTHHNPHFTTTNPFPLPTPAHTPPPTPNRPTLQPHSNPSGQADSALQTGYTLKLPVVRSQHAESALLPGAAAQQRNGKDTPMARQRASLPMRLGEAVREPMLHLPCNVNQRRFGGMFCELVGLTDVHLAASAAQTVQQEGFHLHVAH